MWVYAFILVILFVVFGMQVLPGQICRYTVKYLPEVRGFRAGYFYVLTLIVIINYTIIGVIAYRKRKQVAQMSRLSKSQVLL